MRNSIVFTAALYSLGLGGLGLAATAGAADNGIYIGASVGQANVDVDTGPVRVDGDDTGFKIIAGFRPLDFFAVELNYVDFGKVDSGAFSAEGDAITAYAVGFLPLGPVDLFAKGGVVNSDTKVKGNLGEAFSSDGTDPAYGVGLQFRFLSLSARLEYEIFDVDDVDDLNLLSVGVTYTFL